MGFHWKKPSFRHLISCCQLGVSAFVGELSSGVIAIVFNFLILGIAGNVGVAAYGVVANLSSAVVSASLLSILKLIPGLGTVSAGLMLTAGNYATCTAAGWVYLKALATIAGEDGIIDPSDPDMKKKLKRAAKSQKEESRKLKDEIQKKYIIQNNEDKKNK